MFRILYFTSRVLCPEESNKEIKKTKQILRSELNHTNGHIYHLSQVN